MRAVAAALFLAVAFPAHADVLIDNVNGLTLDEDGRVDHFNGVLVGDDGRIEQVLSRRDKRPGNVDYRFDAKGRVLIPGLIDSHVQVMKLGLSLLTREEAAPASQDGRTLPPPRPEDRDAALAKAQQLLLAQGITAVADMGTTIEDWQAYRRAGDLGRLNLRIVAYAAGPEAMALIGGPGPTPWLYGDRLRLNGLFLALDGTLANRTAALKAPYADDPASTGRAGLTETQLKNLMSRGAIEVADEVVVVGAADPVGLARLARALVELRDTRADAPVRVVVNRMRGSLGWPERDIAGMVEGFARVESITFVPDDQPGADRALAGGRLLTESGESKLLAGLRELAERIVPDQSAGPKRRRAGRALRP